MSSTPPACGPSRSASWPASICRYRRMEHHYLVTEAIPEVKALAKELPLAVDLEGFTYMRQEHQGAAARHL